jgi:2-dehydropantoate 2-reductase
MVSQRWSLASRGCCHRVPIRGGCSVFDGNSLRLGWSTNSLCHCRVYTPAVRRGKVLVPMKILVYGAGVLGTLYAARLQDSGQDVSLVARGRRLANLRQHGLVLENMIGGGQTVGCVRIIERVNDEDSYDLAIVLMRKNQVATVLPILANCRKIPAILFMHNNAAGPDAMVNALGCGRVLLGFPGAGGTLENHVVKYAL